MRVRDVAIALAEKAAAWAEIVEAAEAEAVEEAKRKLAVAEARLGLAEAQRIAARTRAEIARQQSQGQAS